MKNIQKNWTNSRSLLVIALVTVIVFSTLACDDGSNNNSNNNNGTVLNVPNSANLPDFPVGSTPAVTKTDAEQILETLRQTSAIRTLRREINDFIEEYEENLGEDWRDKGYSFTNQNIPGANVKVSSSIDVNWSETGAFKTLSGLRNDDETYEDYLAAISQIPFKVNDKEVESYIERTKGEITADKTIGGVTFASGSTFEEISDEGGNMTVVTAGTLADGKVRFNGYEGYKEQVATGCTVTTSSGSIKIVLDYTGEESASATNTDWEWELGEINETEKCSGSLKIYGKDNAVLIDHPINNWDDADAALERIGYYEVPPVLPPPPSLQRNARSIIPQR